MKKRGMRCLYVGISALLLFVIWTYLIQVIDVEIAGETGREIGFASFNRWFHQLTGVHLWIYNVTDWLGLIPVFVCLVFGIIGLAQWIRRRKLASVDRDIQLLGIYYVLVIAGYLLFEMFPVNYRPILIEGRIEASYPSSTTLLVLGVMPTLVFQVRHRIKPVAVKHALVCGTMVFSSLMVLGRWVAGVHWFTDMIGSVLLSMGLFALYKASVLLWFKTEKNGKKS